MHGDQIIRFVEKLRAGEPRAWVALGLLALLLVAWVVKVNKESKKR